MINSLINPIDSADDPAYPDDLATLSSSSSKSKRRKPTAYLPFAFCLLFSGMAIAFPKVEAICLQHPSHNNKPPTSLILRDWQWDAVKVPITIPKSIRHSRYLVRLDSRLRTS